MRNRFKNSFFNGPTVSMDSGIYSRYLQACEHSPLGRSEGPSIDGYFMTTGCIILLLYTCSPSNIPWAVPTIIVDSVNRTVTLGLLSDIFIKSIEIVLPFFANCNTPAAIIFKLRVVGVVASLPHAFPYFIFWEALHAMYSHVLSCNFSSQATTTLSSLPTQMHPPNNSSIAANTFAYPFNLTVAGGFTPGNYSESTECFPNKVNCSFLAFNGMKTPTAFRMPFLKTATTNNCRVAASAFTTPLGFAVTIIFVAAYYRKSIKCLTRKVFKIMTTHKIISWLRFLVVEMKRKAKYQRFGFSGSFPYPLNKNTKFIAKSQ